MMFRCTRPAVYGPDCPGHLDPSARQGHYIEADTAEQAQHKMHHLFPDDRKFDVQPWEPYNPTDSEWYLGDFGKIVSEGRYIRIRKDQSAIAMVLGGKNPECNANALLMVRAKEMHQLLEEIQVWCLQNHVYLSGHDMMNRLDELIAKAKGVR